MSLVDYDASSSDDEAPELNQTKQPQPLTQSQATAAAAQIKDSSVPQSQGKSSSSKKCSDSSLHSSEPVMEKLPDVSLLLNSSTLPHLSHSSTHSARVAAAMAENASRKRDAALAPASLRNKVPRGTLPHTRNIPDTEGGMLIPPQLRGRSNVATEDIGKLFVQKHPDTLPHRNSD